MIAFTSRVKSLVPTPRAALIPRPPLSKRTVSSWIPVPDEPTIPIVPSRITLANPIPCPCIIVVPASGPNTRRFFS